MRDVDATYPSAARSSASPSIRTELSKPRQSGPARAVHDALRFPRFGFSVFTLLVILASLAYEAALVFTHLLDGQRFSTPYAVPIFDTPFVLVAIGVGYLCLERHRLRNDFQSAALGNMLWLAAVLALAHILAQPDYPAAPSISAGVAPYYYLASYLAVFLGIGLATQRGRRSFPLTDRGRLWVGLAVLGVAATVTAAVLFVQPVLPSTAMTPGRLTSFAVWMFASTSGIAALWALFGARRNWLSQEEDRFSGALLLAVVIWMLGLSGFLIVPFRYSIPWYLAGFARPLGVCVIFMGLLREQVWLYREARTRQHELETLQVQLQAYLRQLQETQEQLLQADKLKALGTLLSSMAHELNNPLTTILMSAQFLQRHAGLSEGVITRLEVIETESARAARIIRDLLLFARRRDAERRPVDFAEVLGATLALHTPEFELHAIRVIQQVEPGLPAIWGDSNQLQQVLLNLFTNAVHAMYTARSRGTLTVQLRREGSELCLQVDDDGPGISREHLGRIFDPFFTTKPVGEGTGLGLSLSLGIVEGHGGRMRAENLIGGGTRITIRLPIDEARQATELPATPKLDGDTRGRILVVDDNTSVRNAIGDVLATIGHDVKVAATSKEAIEYLGWGAFDLVFLDLRLPELDGGRVWQWILGERPALAARVVFITGDILSREIEQFLQRAGRPVIAKPLTVAQVRTAVQDALITRTPLSLTFGSSMTTAD
jgi:signal transduction histidine kinase/CheY-like chemotaxis protein